MNPSISIVIPVFNAQTYLAQTIESILAQNFTDFELILVNDGSTDASTQILAEAAQKDTRIRVLAQENKGETGARNRALEEVCGTYFTFVDADDVLHPDYLALLYQEAIMHQADLVSCDFASFDQDELPLFQSGQNQESRSLNREESLKAFFLDEEKPSVWCRLYHTKTFIDVRFVEGIICAGDVLYSYECFLRARKLQILSTPLYGYRQHPGSIMGSYKHQKITDALRVMKMIYTQSKLKPWFAELQPFLDIFMINHALNYRYPELLDAPYYDWAACDEIRQTLKQSFGMTKERLQKAMAAKLDFKTKVIFLGPEWLAKCLFSYKYKRRQAKLNKN